MMLPTGLTQRFMVVRLISREVSHEKIQADYDELLGLVSTYGGEVVMSTHQNMARRDAATYIGKGKVEEVSESIAKNDIDVVVINDNLRSGQLYTLKQRFELEKPGILVWDRTDLILEIFSKHATTAEAKLQIKLASVRHMGPELLGMGKMMSQQGAGIGTRGMGETNTEIMHRHWRGEIKEIESQLEKVHLNRLQQMNRRKKTGLSTVSIIGYTNAGKTTLFNLLAKKENLVENAPFATLDSSVGIFYLPALRREAFLTDTIGFIENLPTDLIEAFKSTLLETINADLLLHVIDASDPQVQDKIDVVDKILVDLKMDAKKQLYIFNKNDKTSKATQDFLSNQYAMYNPQFISAKSGEVQSPLIEGIQTCLNQR
jgi:GTP-binding protein HflX